MLADPCCLVLEHPSCVVLHELRDEFDVSVIHDEVLVAADRARVVGDDETVLRQSSDRANLKMKREYKLTYLNTRSPCPPISPSICKVPPVPLPHLVGAIRLLIGWGLHIGQGELRTDEKRKLRKRSARWHFKMQTSKGIALVLSLGFLFSRLPPSAKSSLFFPKPLDLIVVATS